MKNDIVIRVDNVWKRYGLPFKPRLQQAVDKLRNQEKSIDAYGPWALKNLNFEVRQGETLGIIGRNGAGKSTLLKLLAGVSPVTRGHMSISGRIFPMIELTAGLHTELSGYENIRILASIMGLGGDALKEKIPAIAEFSELYDKLELPVRTYSSGMIARLGFSVAINIEADILLLDEVLSVGDVSFQKKCLREVETLISSGKTVLFVSHSPYAVERLCDRAIFLQNGEIAIHDQTSKVITSYFQSVLVSDAKMLPEKTQNKITTHPDTGISIDKITLHKPDTDEEIDTLNVGDGLILRVNLSIDEAIDLANISLRVTDTASTVVASLFKPAYDLPKSGHIDCHIASFNVMPGVYYISGNIKTGTGILLASFNDNLAIQVNITTDIHQQTGSIGQFYLESSWCYQDEHNEV